jgi:hypothetical protein
VPKPGYNPGRFFGIDANNARSRMVHAARLHLRRRLGERGGAVEAYRRRLHRPGHRPAERQGLSDRLHQPLSRHGRGRAAHRYGQARPRDNLLEYVNAWKAHKPGLFVFGENLVKGYGWGDLGGGDNGPSFIRPWWYTRLGHDPRDPNSGGDSGFAVLDFGLFSTFRDNLSRGSFGGVGGVLEMDWIYGNATSW